MRQPPDELKKPPAGTDGSKPLILSPRKASTRYRLEVRSASPRPYKRLLRRVCREVTQHPQRLPLAAWRIGGLVAAGWLPYVESWQRLWAAAEAGGATNQDWIRRVMFHGFGSGSVDELPNQRCIELMTGGIE